MTVVPFQPAHLSALTLQPGQAYLQTQMNPEQYGHMLVGDCAFSALAGDTVLCCAGIVPIWEGRGLAWALIDQAAGRQFAGIHRAVKRMLDISTFRRVETHVDIGFAEAHRWMRMLGFQLEGRARAYTPDGRDCDIYARIK